MRSLPSSTILPLTGRLRITQRLLPSSETDGAEMQDVEMQKESASTTNPGTIGRIGSIMASSSRSLLLKISAATGSAAIRITPSPIFVR